MSELGLPPAIPASDKQEPPTAEHVTAVGGLAVCPTSAIYSIPVRSGTPIEVMIGHGSRLPSAIPTRYQATAPSIDVSRIAGSAIAESAELFYLHGTLPTCPGIECRQAARRLSVGRHLHLAMGVWEEARRTIERLEAPSRDETGPRAWEAFKEVAAVLGFTDAELATVIGIGRTTVYTWQREDREPRRGTARRIYELHAALRALRRNLGEDGLDAWLMAGSPSRRQVILTGDLKKLGEEIDSELFSTMSRPDFSAVPADRGGVDPVTDAAPPRPSSRRPRRARLR